MLANGCLACRLSLTCMLFHTWPFLLFMLVVLPVFFALRPHTALDPLAAGGLLLLLCVVEPVLPAAGRLLHGPGLSAGHADGPLPGATQATAASWQLDRGPETGCCGRPSRQLTLPDARARRRRMSSARPRFGPRSWSLLPPWCCSWRSARGWRAAELWLFISIFNNLALLLFFKYARFVEENLNQVLAWLHAAGAASRPVRADAARL